MFETLTVLDILSLPIFKTCQLFANKQSINNQVRNITIMDIPDIIQWLKPYEILISGIYLEEIVTPDFIKELASKNIPAIITKKKFRHLISTELIDACYEFNIALILIDDHYSWSQITSDVQQLYTDNYRRIIYDGLEFYEKMLNIMSTQRKTNDLCHLVYNMSDLTLAICNQELSLTDYSHNFPWNKAINGLTKKQLLSLTTIGYDLQNRPKSGFTYTNEFLDAHDSKLFFFPLRRQHILEGYILIKLPKTQTLIDVPTLSKLSSIQTVLSFKEKIYSTFEESSLHYRNIILENLLNPTNQEKPDFDQLSISLGHQLERHYTVLLIKQQSPSQAEDNLLTYSNFIRFNSYFLKEANFRKESVLLFIRQNYLVMLVGESIENLASYVNFIYQELVHFYDCENFQIGISQPHSLTDLHQAWKEAEFALSFIENTVNEQHFQYYSRIGILNLFTNTEGQINSIYIQSLIATYIQPLLAYDSKHQTQLYLTLKTFINHNCSYTITSETLFIHTNSLRARLARIEELCHVDLRNSNDFLNVNLAQRLYEIQK